MATIHNNTRFYEISSIIVEQIKKDVYESVLEELVEQFKSDVERTVRVHMERITHTSLEKFHDVLDLRDKFALTVVWKND